MQFGIDGQQPNVSFRNQSPKTGVITDSRTLWFIQQIQTAAMALQIIE
jgi:hypothetical protein